MEDSKGADEAEEEEDKVEVVDRSFATTARCQDTTRESV